MEAGRRGCAQAPWLLSGSSEAPCHHFCARPCPRGKPDRSSLGSPTPRPGRPWASSLWAQSWIACLAFHNVSWCVYGGPALPRGLAPWSGAAGLWPLCSPAGRVWREEGWLQKWPFPRSSVVSSEVQGLGRSASVSSEPEVFDRHWLPVLPPLASILTKSPSVSSHLTDAAATPCFCKRGLLALDSQPSASALGASLLNLPADLATLPRDLPPLSCGSTAV